MRVPFPRLRIAAFGSACAGLLTLVACFEASIERDTALTCSSPDDCPPGFTCVAALAQCIADARIGTICGDGALGGSEECDDGIQNNAFAPDACRPDCRRPACGDGVVDDGEACDDGEGNADDVADACRTDCRRARCGDGVVDANEACDDGSANDDVTPDACRTDCRAAHCGDGVLDAGEQCDAGSRNSDVLEGACRTVCALAACGDGVIDPGEECDDGLENDDRRPDACRTTCRAPRCGDGVQDGDEGCDDGIENDDERPDACRTSCIPASCGDGIVDGGEVCDDGSGNSDSRANACRRLCVLPRCGDGVRDLSEACDDGGGNGDAPDACRQDCRLPRCGDGVVDGDERCDDGVAVGGPCAATCAKENRCGDGVVDDEEPCDDGNQNAADGCDACHLQDRVQTLLIEGDGGRSPFDVSVRVTAIARDRFGRVFVSDGPARVIRRLDPDGSFTIVAGNGTDSGPRCNGGPARATALSPGDLTVGADGSVLVIDSPSASFSAARICRLTPAGTLEHVAGDGGIGNPANGAKATEAPLNAPAGLALRADGALVYADRVNHRVYSIDLNGVSNILLGLGAGFIDGAPSVARFRNPADVAFDEQGRLWIADAGNKALRRLDADGVVRTIAGGPTTTDTSDGPGSGRAVSAGRIVAEGTGVVVADGVTSPPRLRRVDDDGLITTLLGRGAVDFDTVTGPLSAADVSLRCATIGATGDGGLLFAGCSTVGRLLEGTAAPIAGRPTGAPVPGRRDALSTSVSGAVVVGGAIIAGAGPELVRVVDDTLEPIALDVCNGAGVSVIGAGPDGDVVVKCSAPCEVKRVTLETGEVRRLAGCGGFQPTVQVDIAGDGRAVIVVTDPVFGSIGNPVGDRPVLVDVDDATTTVPLDRAVSAVFEDDGALLVSVADIDLDFGVAQSSQLVRVGTDGAMQVLFGANGLGSIFCRDIAPGGPFPEFATLVRAADGSILVQAGCTWRLVDDGLQAIGTVGFTLGGTTTAAALAPGSGAGRIVPVAGGFGIVDDVEGRIRPVAGAFTAATLGTSQNVSLRNVSSMLSIDDDIVFALGDGRLVRHRRAPGTVGLVLGLTPSGPIDPAAAATRAGYARPLTFPVVLTAAPGGLRAVGSSIVGITAVDDDPFHWPLEVTGGLAGVGGAVALSDGRMVVSLVNEHCLVVMDRDGTLRPFFGTCGVESPFLDNLSAPRGLAVSRDDVVYVADQGNNRVLRIDGGIASLVVGDGSRSSAGQGSPARIFPVDAPQSLAADPFGNLYVSSRTTVRQIVDRDGDGADGDDEVITVFGARRDSYPESAAFCIDDVVVSGDGRRFAAFDRCQEFLVEVEHVRR